MDSHHLILEYVLALFEYSPCNQPEWKDVLDGRRILGWPPFTQITTTTAVTININNNDNNNDDDFIESL